LGIGTTFQVAGAATTSPMTAEERTAAIEEGKEIYLRGCSSCHGLNAEGGAIAPSLIGVGAASVDFQVATGRMPMADMSQQAMRKTPVYNDEEVAALAAYVASLAPGPEILGVKPVHIYEAMITGPQSMPVFSDKTLTPKEKLSIIKWIKAAEKEPQLGGVALGRVGPVTEGLLVWTLGLGLLIGIAVWLAAKAK